MFRAFAEVDLHDRVTFIGAGKLGFPGESLLALGLGADVIYAAGEAMMSIGCIQAQRCHNGPCPTGIAIHNKWLVRGLDPTDKSARLANYVISLRHELLNLANACGEAIDLLGDDNMTEALWDRYDYDSKWLAVAEFDRLAAATLPT